MLRPTFSAFETARKALTTSQLGLDTVGHNIANVNTPGYTRQRNDQVSFAISRSKEKYALYNTGYTVPGQGSEVVGINQIRNIQLDKRYRTEAASTGEYNTISNNLAEINKIFDEISTTGSHAKMGEFLTALDRLIANADTKEHANVLRNKAQEIAQVLGENSRSLDNAEIQVKQEFEATVTDVNKILEQIAMLNTKIKEDNFYGNPANELNDQRNLLIDQLSEFVDIDVKRTPITTSGILYEQISIEMRGTANLEKDIPNITLVDGANYSGFKITTDDLTGDTRVHIMDGASGMPLMRQRSDGTKSPDITGEISSGGFKGHLVTLNGRGVFAENGQNAFRGIPYYREALNDYAATFAQTMNKMNELKVYDSTGELSHTINRDLFVANDGSGVITAANMTVSDAWLKNPAYIEVAAKNNALYTDNSGFLFKKGVDTDGNPIQTKLGVKYTDVHSVDKDGYLLNQNGQMLGENGQVVNDAADALNISALQRAITVDSVVEDPAFKTEYYWDATKGGFIFNTGSVLLNDPPLDNPANISGVDENGYLLDAATGKRIVLDTTTKGLGTIYGKVGGTFDKNYFLNATGNFKHKNGELTTLDPTTVSGVDNAGYLLDSNGKRLETQDPKYPADATKKIFVRVTDLQQFQIELHRSDLKRSTAPGDKMYSVGDPTPNELLPGKAANDNLLAIKQILTAEKQTTFKNGFTGSYQQYLIGFQSDMAQDYELNDAMLQASLKVLTGLSDSRDSISAVSIDEEGVSMMTYQNYYNAAARYMTVLDEALGQIIQGMGVVGR